MTGNVTGTVVSEYTMFVLTDSVAWLLLRNTDISMAGCS